MKKFLSLLLAMMLLATFSMTVFAAGGTGSITINGISSENTYEIYKLLNLESYNKDTGAYSYKIEADWTAFFATDDAKTYVAADADGYVTWVAALDDDTISTFAKLALAYAKANSIAPVKSSKNAGDFEITGNTGKFSNLELGYYLVDSTMGALCGLTTTNPDASINAKNGAPTVDKQVKEDSTDQWGGSNTADIGQTIYFRVTINVHAGAENYVLHDKMSDGLTFQKVTKVEHVIPGQETHEMTLDTDYKITTPGTDEGCDFEVRFTESLCNKLETNDKIIIYYEAMLNRKAIIAGEGNQNEAWLTFGEGHESNHDPVNTFTYGIDIVKTDSQNTLIDGARFKIYDAASGGNEVPVVLMEDNVTYRRARADEPSMEIVVKDGKVRVLGFDNGTYYLEEILAPAGYNMLTARQKFIISDSNLDAVFNDGIYSTGSGVHVVNKTGSMLPETGGIGTVLFTVCGGLLVLITGVVLVTKKRMSKIVE
ncbi:MAG: SpaH/EbpB family LPXTG-anchored major pilin [Clostridia bacterium]|nr:SpaH/EbpB family LPXTG-anchored major pilin [Clostridia bacterium]